MFFFVRFDSIEGGGYDGSQLLFHRNAFSCRTTAQLDLQIVINPANDYRSHAINDSTFMSRSYPNRIWLLMHLLPGIAAPLKQSLQQTQQPRIPIPKNKQ